MKAEEGDQFQTVLPKSYPSRILFDVPLLDRMRVHYFTDSLQNVSRSTLVSLVVSVIY